MYHRKRSAFWRFNLFLYPKWEGVFFYKTTIHSPFTKHWYFSLWRLRLCVSRIVIYDRSLMPRG